MSVMGPLKGRPSTGSGRPERVEVRDAGGVALRARLEATLDAARQELVASTERGEGGSDALARYSEGVDAIVRELVDGARAQTTTPIAVCALGGYGRRALSLHSDIDLLLLFGGPIGRPEERFVKALLHPLWDLRFTVGHHVRELADFDRLEPDVKEGPGALRDIWATRTILKLGGDRRRVPRMQASDRLSAAEEFLM